MFKKMGKYSMKSVAENIRAKDSRLEVLLIIFLILASFLPRVLDLGTFLTADEKTWIVRSYEFIRAFKDVRFNDMLQTTHPGVTTMWVSGAAITAKMFFAQIPFTSNGLIHFVKVAQFPIAFLNALAIPLIYLLLKKITGRTIAFLAAILIALDPYIIGYSRVIHVDALLGSILTIAVLSTILYARSLDRRLLVISAVSSALALLTKVPAVFIFPFFPVALFVMNTRQFFTRAFLVQQSRNALIWLLAIIIIILVVWPVLLWVPNPGGNILVLRRDVTTAATTPHNMNEEYSIEPLHYPAALLIRSNPVAFVGVIAGCVGLLISAVRKKLPREIFLVAVYLFGFVIMMTLGAKKGDRYIMPAFFALDILAAYGIVWLTQLLTSPSPSFVRRGNATLPLTKGESEGVSRGAVICFSLCIVYLLGVVVSYHPYEVSYSSPLFPDNLSQELGWGEGLEQVGAWLNKNYPNETTASWYPEELDVYTNGPVAHINAHLQNQVRFVVLYRNMFGREPSHYANDFIDEYYKKMEPVFVVKVHGKEFAWVYEKPSFPNNIGELTPQTIVTQEVVVNHAELAGVDILPATRGGQVDTGIYRLEIANTLVGAPLFSQEIPVAGVIDSQWYSVKFPDSLGISVGNHVFVRIRALNATSPYPSIRFARAVSRSTPVYISRNGDVRDAEPKPGSLGVRLTYHAIDGTIATETQTKLLR